jgi:hypothetical protein
MPRRAWVTGEFGTVGRVAGREIKDCGESWQSREEEGGHGGVATAAHKRDVARGGTGRGRPRKKAEQPAPGHQSSEQTLVGTPAREGSKATDDRA